MLVDMAAFTPWSALAGGALIGLAAGLFVVANGRIAGISGIVAGMLTKKTRTEGWRMAFLAGLIGSPLLFSLFYPLPEITVQTSWPVIILAGLLGGAGTRLGSGCTSGHGVCGLSRFSMRSLVATLTFMAVGIVTATLIGFWLG